MELSALPEEVLLSILEYCAHLSCFSTFIRLRRVNKQLHRLTEDPSLWKQITHEVELFEGRNIERYELPEWYLANRPLCNGCGVPSKTVFRFAQTFMILSTTFTCKNCSPSLRQSQQCTLTELHSTNPANAVKASKPVVLRHSPSVDKRTSDVNLRTSAERKQREAEHMKLRREELYTALQRNGITRTSYTECTNYIKGQSSHSIEEVVQIVKSKQRHSILHGQRKEHLRALQREKKLLQMPLIM